MRYTVWKRAGLAALVLAGLGLIGAGAAQAQFSDNKIKIGVLDDFSGLRCKSQRQIN